MRNNQSEILRSLSTTGNICGHSNDQDFRNNCVYGFERMENQSDLSSLRFRTVWSVPYYSVVD